jgi:hypothetical protein
MLEPARMRRGAPGAGNARAAAAFGSGGRPEAQSGQVCESMIAVGTAVNRISMSPVFRQEGAAVSGKGRAGGKNREGERGATSRSAPPPCCGAAFRHTPAQSDGGGLELDKRREPSHPDASGYWLPSSNPEMSSSY